MHNERILSITFPRSDHNRILLTFSLDNGVFEDLDITPYSSPPDLPDVMKNQEANGQEQIA